MRRKARRRCPTICAPLWRKTKRQRAFSKPWTAPIATRSCTGSTPPRSPRPGPPGSRNSSRCWEKAKPSIRRSPGVDVFAIRGPDGVPPDCAAHHPSCDPQTRLKNPRISLSFRDFGARTPPRPQPPHPWRLAVDRERAAMPPLTFRKQGLKQNATVKELKATARPAGGKGAAPAERRAGSGPGVIYGNKQPPVTISVDDADLRQRILAGRFLTTIYDLDL